MLPALPAWGPTAGPLLNPGWDPSFSAFITQVFLVGQVGVGAVLQLRL